ncbi:hypothetical protein ABZ357_40590 [Streptomyces sp. NPDC005917]
MRLRKRAVAVVFAATAASKTPATTTHDTTSAVAGESGTVTVLCANGCYQ